MSEKSSPNSEREMPVTTAEGAIEHAHDLVERLMGFAPHQRSVKSALDWVARLTKGLRPSRVKALYYREVSRPAYDEVAELEAVLERQTRQRAAYDTQALNAQLSGFKQEIDRISAVIEQTVERINHAPLAGSELGKEPGDPPHDQPVADPQSSQKSDKGGGFPNRPRQR